MNKILLLLKISLAIPYTMRATHSHFIPAMRGILVMFSLRISIELKLWY